MSQRHKAISFITNDTPSQQLTFMDTACYHSEETSERQLLPLEDLHNLIVLNLVEQRQTLLLFHYQRLFKDILSAMIKEKTRYWSIGQRLTIAASRFLQTRSPEPRDFWNCADTCLRLDDNIDLNFFLPELLTVLLYHFQTIIISIRT